MKMNQVKQDILNQWESMGFPKLRRSNFNLLHASIEFDGQRCEFSLKNNSLICWLCFRPFLCRTQK